MEAVREALLNAETAFSNKQYREALQWYHKVLEATPDDIYALSRAGAICVPLGRFQEALRHFKRARELDPENGDNAFNYANACFFSKDNVSAFKAYVEAEKLGCSEDVIPRLYYQLALMCSMRQDIPSALIYFQKCEESDPGGMVSLSPDLISEKLKLYMAEQDYSNAEKCAAQYVAIQPSALKSYMIYFSILMAKKDYGKAETILLDAEKFAAATEEDCVTVRLQRAALYIAEGTERPAERAERFHKAAVLLTETYQSCTGRPEQAAQTLLALAEVYLKSTEYQKSIQCVCVLLAGNSDQQTIENADCEDLGELSQEEIEEMILEDIEVIQEKICQGELDGDPHLLCVEVDYDEEGREIRRYEESAFASMSEVPSRDEEEGSDEEKPENYDLPLAVREKAYFTLLSAHMGAENYLEAKKCAQYLKHSENKYYAYFGLYAEALLSRKAGGNMRDIRGKYDAALAFFRSKMFSDPGDSLAAIFRARLYAEDGKYAKAEELAQLLAEEDRAAVLDYIKTCRA